VPKIGSIEYAGLKHRHLLDCVEGLRRKSHRVSLRVNEHMMGMSDAIERERVMAQAQKRRFDTQEVRRLVCLVGVA
jgi:predicted GIY-YIG superfamily endonuclease